MNSSPSIFNYQDYRVLMGDLYASLKKEGIATFRSLAKKGGFASSNFLKLVIDGKRNLTQESAEQVCDSFDLKEKERDFFLILVRYQHEKNLNRKSKLFLEMAQYKNRSPLQQLSLKQFMFLSNWHYVAIRELVGMEKFKEDTRWISKLFKNAISPVEIKKALALMLDLGLLQRDSEGKLAQSSPHVTTGDDVSSLALLNCHKALLQEAIAALDSVKHKDRDISGIMVPASKENLVKIKQDVRKFRQNLLQAYGKSSLNSSEKLYYVALQIIPLTEELE